MQLMICEAPDESQKACGVEARFVMYKRRKASGRQAEGSKLKESSKKSDESESRKAGCLK